MPKKRKVLETGAIVSRHETWRGAMISVAITLSNEEWDALTDGYALRWEDVEEDMDVRAMTLDERIALFVSDESEGWFRRDGDDVSADEPPF